MRSCVARLAGGAFLFGVVLLNPLPASAATVRWVATADGFWDVGANWSTGQQPGPADDVVIDVPHNPRVVVRSGVQAVHSVASRNPLVLQGGVLAIGATSSLANSLTLAGGAVQGPGDLTIDGLFTWTAGCLAGGRTIARGGLLVNGGEQKCMRGQVLDNVGQASFREGELTLDARSTINNLSGATFKMGDVCLCGGTFNNLGTLDKVSGTGLIPVGTRPNNAGSVLIHSGGMNLLGGGEAAGSFWSNLGTQLTFASSYALTGGATLDGPGRPVRIEAGEVTASGLVRAKNIDIVGGTLRVNNTLTLRDLDLQSGSLVGTDDGQVTATHALTWSDGVVSDGAGCPTLDIPGGARLVRTGGAVTHVGCVFIRNAGNAVWVMTDPDAQEDVNLINTQGATFDLRGPGCLCGFPGVLENDGRLLMASASTYSQQPRRTDPSRASASHRACTWSSTRASSRSSPTEPRGLC